MLRFATAGSVDDGKSTLIGRLLYDTKSIFEDQLDAVEAASRARAATTTSTSRCSPTACGPSASRASHRRRLPLLRDARSASSSSPTPPGTSSTPATWSPAPRPPTWRSSWSTPARACSSRPAGTPSSPRCCGVPHLVLAVNKMDLVDYAAGGLRRRSPTSSPRSRPSSASPTSPSSRSRRSTATTSSPARENMPWYEGPSLLHHLETCTSPATATWSTCASRCSTSSARSPTQLPRLPRLRRHGRRRRVQARRRGHRAALRVHQRRIAAIDTADGAVDEAFPPMSVTVRLADDIDISRGDMICRPHNQPAVDPGHRRDGLLDGRPAAARRAQSWRSSTPPARRGRSSRTCTTASTSTRCTATRRRTELALNEIGRVRLRTTEPLFADEYRRNRADRRLHPHRRGHQPHRRRRDDRRHELMPGTESDVKLAIQTGRPGRGLLLLTRDNTSLRGSGSGGRGRPRRAGLPGRQLASARPDDARVLSEEAVDDPSRLEASRVWIIDPLDGTREYSEGRHDWAVHVALCEDGEPRCRGRGAARARTRARPPPTRSTCPSARPARCGSR